MALFNRFSAMLNGAVAAYFILRCIQEHGQCPEWWGLLVGASIAATALSLIDVAKRKSIR